MRQQSRHLAEFDAFWKTEKGPFLRMARGETEKQTKNRILRYYAEAWRNAGCPERFLPEPMTAGFQGPLATRPEKIAEFDQDLFPNRGWIL